MKTPYSKPTDASKARLYTYIGGAVAVLTAIYLFQTIFVGGGLSHLRTDTFPDSFRLAVIADLDQSSKKEGKASWTSQYMTVSLSQLLVLLLPPRHVWTAALSLLLFGISTSNKPHT